MTREKMSRPSSSVPNQCVAPGGCKREGRSIAAGFCGAIQGAKSANKTKITTSTTPEEANTLRRPSADAVENVEAMTMENYSLHRRKIRLWSYRLQYFLERPHKHLVLFRSANGDAHSVADSPRPERPDNHAFGLHALREFRGRLLKFEVDKVCAGGHGEYAGVREMLQHPGRAGQIVRDRLADVGFVFQSGERSGFRYHGNGKRVAHADKVLEQLRLAAAVAHANAGEAVRF